MIPERHHPFEIARIHDPQEYEALQRELQQRGDLWYTRTHCHACGQCGRVISHTGLEATRDGDVLSHQCCGRDVRENP